MSAPLGAAPFVLTKGDPSTNSTAGRLVFTGDGGATWAQRSDPCPSVIDEKVAAVNDTDLWAACAGPPTPATTGGPGSTNQLHWVYRSHDGGRSWQLVAAPPSSETPTVGQISPLTLFGRLAAVDNQHAWIALDGAQGRAESSPRPTEAEPGPRPSLST